MPDANPDTGTAIVTAIISGAVAMTGALLTLAGGMFGRWYEQRQANKRPFLEKQLELSFEATDAASRLANETKSEAWEEARLTFWRLYWGPLSMVEDEAVKKAMETFGTQVSAIPVPPPELPRPELQQLSYRLAHAARNLVISSWKIRDLPALQDVPNRQDTKFVRAPPDVKAEPPKAGAL